jgi:hypothetical protein
MASKTELMDAVRGVLMGQITREAVSLLGEPYKVHIGVAIMLATGYHLTPDGQIIGSPTKVLGELTQTGLDEASPHYVQGEVLHQAAALSYGLYGSLPATVTPPSWMVEIIYMHTKQSALTRYMQGIDDNYGRSQPVSTDPNYAKWIAYRLVREFVERCGEGNLGLLMAQAICRQ